MKNYVFILLAIGNIFTGCSKYLDIYPKSTVSEGGLFENETGFQQALAGIYSQFSADNLYGDKLTMSFMSALGQDYNISQNDGADLIYADVRALRYESTQVRNHLKTIWLEGYKAIAGVNKILLHTEEDRSVLSQASYGQIRGEALGLRAFMHFDLLRLFGPEYSSGVDLKAIPFRATVDQNPVPPSTSKEIVELILKDLTEAQELLKPVDPIQANLDAVNLRRIKMNYFATKALEARIRLFMGDKVGAFNAAKEVIDSQKFPFVDKLMAGSSNAEIKDRLFLSELIFAVRVQNINTKIDRYFKYIGGAIGYNFVRSTDDYNSLYENSATDIRRVHGFELNASLIYPSKYWQTNTRDSTRGPILAENAPSRKDRIVPLIRMSEMYYIMAETASTPAEGLGYINTVRDARGLTALSTNAVTAQFLEQEITKEYRKEFYAEGQVFLYYKRKKYPRLPFMDTDISQSAYKLPIPNEELEFNPNY